MGFNLLPIRPHNLINRNIRIPIAGGGIALAVFQLDGVLRTVLDAGEAIFAIALEDDAARREGDALTGTDAGAETAIDAAVRTQAEEGFAPDGEDRREVGEDGFATLALLVAEDGDVVFFGGDVGDGLGKLGVFLLVYFHFFGHVENGEEVIDHQDGGDIIEAHATAEGEVVPPLDYVARPAAVSNNGKEIGGFQGRIFEETLDDLGGTRLVVGENETDFVGLEDEVSFFQDLGDTQGRVRELEGGVETVAGGGEIENQAFLSFFGTRREGRDAQ